MRRLLLLLWLPLLALSAAETLRSYAVPTTAMDPTIKRGEHVVVDEAAYRSAQPKRGDVVAYRSPSSPETVMVKRVVGLPLERIEIRHKTLFVNGKAVEESYVVHRDEADHTGASEEPFKSRDSFGPISLSLNQYFVLGDNRDSSLDSRYHGPVSASALSGRVVTVRGESGVREIH